MEYFVGALTTIIVIFISSKLYNNKTNDYPPIFFKYSQAYLYDLLKDILPTNNELKQKRTKSQSINFNKKNTIRIIFLDNKAYWIANNTFFSADVINGEIVEDSTSQVDTMGMSKVELDRMSFIVEKLTEGN